MDSNNSKKNALYEFILKLVKMVGGFFRGMKCKSACCNSECLNKEVITISPQDQPKAE